MKQITMGPVVLSLLLLLAFCSLAQADGIPAAPKECPKGTRTITIGHRGVAAGHACQPIHCQQDSNCTNGLICKEMSLCLGGGYAQGVCAKQTDCDLGKCIKGKHCVPKEYTPPSASKPNPGSNPAKVEKGCQCGTYKTQPLFLPCLLVLLSLFTLRKAYRKHGGERG